jgi:hypothetical protein
MIDRQAGPMLLRSVKRSALNLTLSLTLSAGGKVLYTSFQHRSTGLNPSCPLKRGDARSPVAGSLARIKHGTMQMISPSSTR